MNTVGLDVGTGRWGIARTAPASFFAGDAIDDEGVGSGTATAGEADVASSSARGPILSQDKGAVAKATATKSGRGLMAVPFVIPRRSRLASEARGDKLADLRRLGPNEVGMQLPGRLRSTSLGDLLGVLCRASATGTLELVEDRARVHRICLVAGLVVAVELDGASPSLAEILRVDGATNEDILRRSLLRAMASRKLHGEVLIDEFCISPAVVGNALRRQLLLRLVAIERVADARICFRVAVRPPREALRHVPLQPAEFLHGRRRARGRSSGEIGMGNQRTPSASTDAETPCRAGAWRVLGLAPGAEAIEIKRAYRRLARTFHPDLHPEATREEHRDLQARFVAITEAFRALER